MSYRSPIAALLLVGLLAPLTFAGWWDDLDKGQVASLSDLIAQPAPYRGKDVSFFCVFHQADDVYNPLATPFNAERYQNLAVWADGAPVWEQDTFQHDYPFLYLRRSNPQYAELTSLPPFTRIEVTGRIRAVHRAMPFIEVISFRPTAHRLGKLVVQSVMAGDRYAEMADDELAYENYKRALRPDLPPSYEMLVRKRVAEGLRRLGKLEEANRLEGGPILANSAAPEPRAGARIMPEPDPTVPLGPITSDFPGQPDAGETPITSDFPGEPTAVPTAPTTPITSDFPGAPMSGDGGIVRADDVVEERYVPPVLPSALEAAGPTPAVQLPGAPPRRAPRLAGAK